MSRKTKNLLLKKSIAHAPMQLPPGFHSANVEGSFGVLHDFEKQSVLQGKCLSIKTVNKGTKKENEVMTLKKKDGSLASVWNSWMLNAIFEKSTIGKEVHIEFLGLQPMSGNRNPMKLFNVGVK